MAKDIGFYRDHEKVESLKNSNETQKFVDIFNRTFDALNRKYPAEGIRHNSIDFDVSFTPIDFQYIKYLQ